MLNQGIGPAREGGGVGGGRMLLLKELTNEAIEKNDQLWKGITDVLLDLWLIMLGHERTTNVPTGAFLL